MARIDADAHVDENDDTWSYIPPDEARFRPITLDVPRGPNQRPDQRWSVEGVQIRRPVRDYRRTGATEATSQLLDVEARLRHLDELRIDTQVIFPTVFIRSRFVGHEELEIALCRAYNRWISEKTQLSGGRLRWVAMLPLLTMGVALEELTWAKDHGACGVFKKGVECMGRAAGDPYFFPLYEQANELDIPICIHTGSEGLAEGLAPASMDAAQAFTPLVASGVLDTYHDLRVGFIEAGASWVPYLLTDLASMNRRGHPQDDNQPFSIEIDRKLFRRLRLYVACQSHDDLAYIVQFGMEDNLMVGTDYTHADQSAELRALDVIEAQGESGTISAAIAHKILEDNPRAFFGL